MSCEAHVAGSVGDDVVGVCYNIVQKLVDGCDRRLCCAFVSSANLAECDYELVVDHSPVVEEYTKNALDPAYACDI